MTDLISLVMNYFSILNACYRNKYVFLNTYIAVLTALQGLQEKIKKLEIERCLAEENLKSLTTETAHYKEILQKEQCASQDNRHATTKHNQGQFYGRGRDYIDLK